VNIESLGSVAKRICPCRIMLGNLDRCGKTISEDRIIAKVKVAAISSKDSVGLKNYDASIPETEPVRISEFGYV